MCISISFVFMYEIRNNILHEKCNKDIIIIDFVIIIKKYMRAHAHAIHNKYIII